MREGPFCNKVLPEELQPGYFQLKPLCYEPLAASLLPKAGGDRRPVELSSKAPIGKMTPLRQGSAIAVRHPRHLPLADWALMVNGQQIMKCGNSHGLVGVAGFEPATSCSQGTRANQAALHPDQWFRREALSKKFYLSGRYLCRFSRHRMANASRLRLRAKRSSGKTETFHQRSSLVIPPRRPYPSL